jgi:flagellar assembly protein FliH
MVRSRIIDRADASEVDRWHSPSVDGSAAEALRGAGLSSAHLLTAGQLDQLQKQVHQEAYARGFDEGIAAGNQEASSRAARLAALAEALAQPLQNVDRAVEDEIVALAVALASHLVRRGIDHDPALLRDAVHDCLAVLPSSARDVTLFLHPSDAVLLRTHLTNAGEQRFKLAEDPNLARGDLRVTSASTQIDGRLEARLMQMLAVAKSGPPEDLSA